VYSEVLRVLVENPTNYASPLTTLNHILGNMQHLINLMRPVQASVCVSRTGREHMNAEDISRKL